MFVALHVHLSSLHKALDRKVWLPSGGSLIVRAHRALTVIDVNTGKNVGRSSLEETVFKNNSRPRSRSPDSCGCAHRRHRGHRLHRHGGRGNRDQVIQVSATRLARDKTRTQVFDISDLGLVEMTRKRIGEGLLESFTSTARL